MTRFAFIFPGQGSQSIGMLSEMSTQYPIVKKTFRKASKILGYNLWNLVQYGPVEELNKTWRTQPALLTASVALWNVWHQKRGKMPILMAGHSLGEYSALVCAGVIDFSDAIHLVEMRGKFMQEAVPEGIGAMIAIVGLDNDAIVKVCEESAEDQIVTPVSFNSSDQVVIAGHREAVERAGIACKEAGAKKTFLLPISVPSHCILMKSASEKLAEELKKIRFSTPLIPVVNNIDVKCETTSEAICNALIRQLYNPVQWVKTIKFISTCNVKHLYEIGPGRVLTDLTKRIISTLTTSTLNKPDHYSALMMNDK